MSAHPTVRQSVVLLAREDRPGDKHLVAYVVGDGGKLQAGDDVARERIANWNTLYEDLYGQAAGRQESGFDITGWNSSYTGAAIPAGQMEHWRSQTVSRIRGTGAKRVWELGCGTGLLLLQMAPGCSDYLGTDFSSRALTALQGEVESRGLEQVRLERRLADDFTGIGSGRFDLVVLNSVMQYFPSVDYLRHVLEGAAAALSRDGVLFVGDVRSLPLLEAFHASVQLYRAAADLPVQELRARVDRALEVEEELALDPDYFRGLCRELPLFSHAEILVKRGRDDNEMTRYRYDVFLYMGEAAEPVKVSTSLDWTCRWWATWSRSKACWKRAPRLWKCWGFPMPGCRGPSCAGRRLAQAEGTAGELRERVAASTWGIEPEALWEVGERNGYGVRVTWSREQGVDCVDVMFERARDDSRRRCWVPGRRAVTRTSSSQGNNPLGARQSHQLAPALRTYLQAKLPEYMVPTAFVMLERLPLTPNGKVDRRALPAPDAARPALSEQYVAPRTPVEQQLVEIWCAVLGLDRVGVLDNFFHLGGHSLLGTQVISRVRDRCHVEVPLRSIFESPTVVELSRHVERAQRSELPSITPVDRGVDLPLSFAQERLWFLHNLGAGSAYHMPVVLRLVGQLDVDAMRRSFEETVRRHEVLRTTIDGRKPISHPADSPARTLGAFGVGPTQYAGTGAGVPPTRQRGDRKALRPHGGMPASHNADSPWRPGAHPGYHAPPHRGGRLVDGRAGK